MVHRPVCMRCEKRGPPSPLQWSFIREIPWANHIGGKMGLFRSTRVAQETVEERLSEGLAVRSMTDAQHWAVPRN
jgi:hypothetical protein